MRDAQSLLDQLLASGSPLLTVEVVHGLLGHRQRRAAAGDDRRPGRSRRRGGASPARPGAGEGVQPAELLGGLLDFLRDAMVLAVGAESILLAVTPRQRPRLQRIVERWPIDAILAALQILAECRARMRGSLHGRMLVELALVRVARLENLTRARRTDRAARRARVGSRPRRAGRTSRSSRDRKPGRRRSPSVSAPAEPAAKPLAKSPAANSVQPAPSLAAGSIARRRSRHRHRAVADGLEAVPRRRDRDARGHRAS